MRKLMLDMLPYADRVSWVVLLAVHGALYEI